MYFLFIWIHPSEKPTMILGIHPPLLAFHSLLLVYSIIWISAILKYKNVNMSKLFLKNPKTILEYHNYFIKSFPYFLVIFIILVSLYFYYKDIISNNLYHGLFQGFIIVIQFQLIATSLSKGLTLSKDYIFTSLRHISN